MIELIINELNNYAITEKIPDYKRFFKTNAGEYGEGDEFLGINVPNIRRVVKRHFLELSFSEIKYFLCSKFHEYRMFALLILTYQYKSKKFCKKDEIFEFYMYNISQVNNWDLVDVTCPHIIGVHLLNKDRSLLYNLAYSYDLWKRRISIISTFAFINLFQFSDTLKIADILINDSHDLIHKAVGWAIRNVGNKNLNTMIEYLNPRYKYMSRTTLRYSIEKLGENIRQKYLQGLV